MFIDNYEASENETDQEVAQTHDARNKIAKTVCFLKNLLSIIRL